MNLILKNFTLLNLEEHIEVLSIRNSEHVRNNMKTKNVITIDNHLKWIENLKEDTNNKYYVVLFDEKIVGAIYITDIDFLSKNCTWGLYFKRGVNPFIPSYSTFEIINKIFFELNLEILNLEVNKKNLAAYKFDLSFGFKVYGEKNEFDIDYYLMNMKKSFWKNNREIGVLGLIYKKLKNINLQIKG